MAKVSPTCLVNWQFAALCLLKYKLKVLKMDNRKSGVALAVICSESPGCFEIDPDSGEPLGSFVYSELISLCYTSDSLESADDKDSASIVFLYNLIYPSNDVNETINKMRPECLKLVIIIQKCKLKQAILTQENAVVGEE